MQGDQNKVYRSSGFRVVGWFRENVVYSSYTPVFSDDSQEYEIKEQKPMQMTKEELKKLERLKENIPRIPVPPLEGSLVHY